MLLNFISLVFSWLPKITLEFLLDIMMIKSSCIFIPRSLKHSLVEIIQISANLVRDKKKKNKKNQALQFAKQSSSGRLAMSFVLQLSSKVKFLQKSLVCQTKLWFLSNHELTEPEQPDCGQCTNTHYVRLCT